MIVGEEEDDGFNEDSKVSEIQPAKISDYNTT
jgi:hypothetical protein